MDIPPTSDGEMPIASVDDIVWAVNEVLSKVRPGTGPVSADTALSSLALESIDYVEVFILLEERSGAVFDLSVAPQGLEAVGDLGRYRRVA